MKKSADIHYEGFNRNGTVRRSSRVGEMYFWAGGGLQGLEIGLNSVEAKLLE